MTLPSYELPAGVLMRAATLDDSAALCDARLRNREHLAPWEPRRSEYTFTLEGVTERMRSQLADLEAGRAAPWHLLDGEQVVGGLTLTCIVLGPFCSAYMGYWIAASHQGKGLVTAAVEHACEAARTTLGLHRIEATTLLDNQRSQAVLRRCGFERIGTAPRYLHVDGAWRDHAMFQRVLHDEDPVGL
ncbi:GNAT family protein [Streptomyces sp. NPDC051940]|uniref:GNAT family N-acetyltransferase n=1 Tax=Streptomyces sp. NPDC051940 TaxID=3155675 RepID=UPI00342E77FB